MKAQSDFKGQYVEIEGYLSTIDSDGKYISVGAAPNDYTYVLQTVLCNIKNDTQKQQIPMIPAATMTISTQNHHFFVTGCFTFAPHWGQVFAEVAISAPQDAQFVNLLLIVFSS